MPTILRCTIRGTASSGDDAGDRFAVTGIRGHVLHEDRLAGGEGRTGEAHPGLDAIEDLPLAPTREETKHPGALHVDTGQEFEVLVQVGRDLVGGVHRVEGLLDALGEGFHQRGRGVRAGSAVVPGRSATDEVAATRLPGCASR